MCMVSAVYDQFDKIVPDTTIPGPNSWPPTIYPWAPIIPPPPSGASQTAPIAITLTPEQLREVIEAFKAAVAAAMRADKATGQADCVDPEKRKLEERVAELEKRLEAMQRALGGGV